MAPIPKTLPHSNPNFKCPVRACPLQQNLAASGTREWRMLQQVIKYYAGCKPVGRWALSCLYKLSLLGTTEQADTAKSACVIQVCPGQHPGAQDAHHSNGASVAPPF